MNSNYPQRCKIFVANAYYRTSPKLTFPVTCVLERLANCEQLTVHKNRNIISIARNMSTADFAHFTRDDDGNIEICGPGYETIIIHSQKK